MTHEPKEETQEKEPEVQPVVGDKLEIDFNDKDFSNAEGRAWEELEEEVVNYTHADNYILDEVTTAITYESDLKKAEELAAKKGKNKIVKEI